MRKFIISLVSNRFGIVLAAVNVCYFASRANNPNAQLLDLAVFCANSPAGLFTLVAGGLIEIFASDLSFQTKAYTLGAFAFVFVILQWLFLAWFARRISEKIRRRP